MSTLIAQNLPNVGTQDCVWGRSSCTKSVVICNSQYDEPITGAVSQNSTGLLFQDGELLPGEAEICFKYPAGVGLNKTDCDQYGTVKVINKERCTVGAGADTQTLYIYIPNAFQDHEYVSPDPNIALGEGIAQVGRFPAGSTPSENLLPIVQGDSQGTYIDKRCFSDPAIDEKENCCYFTAGENIGVGSSMFYNFGSNVVGRADADQNNIRNIFAGVAKEAQVQGQPIKVQVGGCIDTFRGSETFTEQRSCAYLSTVTGAIVPSYNSTFDPDNCYPIGFVSCGKLHMSPLAGCMQDIVERLKILENTFGTTAKKCDVRTDRRGVNNTAANGSFSFTMAENMTVPVSCIETDFWIECIANGARIISNKSSGVYCEGEQHACGVTQQVNAINSTILYESATPNISNGTMGSIRIQDDQAPTSGDIDVTVVMGAPTGAGVPVTINRTGNTLCDTLIFNFVTKFSGDA